MNNLNKIKEVLKKYNISGDYNNKENFENPFDIELDHSELPINILSKIQNDLSDFEITIWSNYSCTISLSLKVKL